MVGHQTRLRSENRELQSNAFGHEKVAAMPGQIEAKREMVPVSGGEV